MPGHVAQPTQPECRAAERSILSTSPGPEWRSEQAADDLVLVDRLEDGEAEGGESADG